MKILISPSAPPRREAGKALLAVLAITGVLGLALTAYLSLVSNQNRAVVRSQVWNSALAVAEAGIEEALTHCYKNYGTNMVANGWVISGNAYVKSNAVASTDPSRATNSFTQLAALNGYYMVSISTNLPYIITAKGHYPMPATSTFVSRTVRVTTRNLGVFFAGLVVKDSIDMNGNNVLTDSYDSTDPAKSTLGRYDVTKRGDKGDVATINGLTDSLSVGNADVWGRILTGPSGTANIGPNGVVGDLAWHISPNIGLKPGWWINDLNFSLPDIVPPFTSGLPPDALGGLLGGLWYDKELRTGNYSATTFGGKIRVTGHAVLYVSGDIKFVPSDYLTIESGASLTIYCAAPSAIFSVINNANTDPRSFTFFGLNSNTSVDAKGQSPWTGRIYAPYAFFTMNGAAEVSGSIVARRAKVTGTSQVHYDESLVNSLPSRGFITVNWEEL